MSNGQSVDSAQKKRPAHTKLGYHGGDVAAASQRENAPMPNSTTAMTRNTTLNFMLE